MFENVQVTGLPSYESITISYSAEEAVRTASLTLVPQGGGIAAMPGEAVTISAGADILLTGYVRDVMASHEKDSRSLSVTVVSRTVDATECSVDHPTGELLNLTIGDIARNLDGGKIGVEDDGDLPVEPRHKVEIGETLFSTVERRCRGRGVLIHDTPKGKLKLATKPEGTHSGGLIFGVNVEKASASLTERGRYSKVKVRGQSSEGTDKQQLRPETYAVDVTVTRDRTRIVHHEGETTIDRQKTRAEWHVKRGAGNGTTASVTVTGWRDAAGKIWDRNWLVYIEDEWIGLSGMMLIKSVTLSSSGQDEGTTATLELCDPRALGGENPRGKTAGAFAASAVPNVDYEDQ